MLGDYMFRFQTSNDNLTNEVDDDDDYSLFADFDDDDDYSSSKDTEEELAPVHLLFKDSSCAYSVSTCCSSTTTSESERSSSLSYPSMKHVRFSHVEVREYAITAGNHPSCSSEPALTLDWKYATPTRIEIDTYSEAKNEKVKKIMRIPRWRRIALLREVAKMTNRDLLALGLSKNGFNQDEGSKRYAQPLKSKLIYERSLKYFTDGDCVCGIPRSESKQNGLNLF